MKLIIIIVQDEDVPKLVDTFMEQKIGVTRLATTGGFLRKGNTTLLCGADEKDLDKIMGIIEKTCHRRREYVTPIAPMATLDFIPMPVQVDVGGATIFIMDCEMKKI